MPIDSDERRDELSAIYRRRFAATSEYRQKVWQVLTGDFFSRWIRPEDIVLDLGCGYGEFINNVSAQKKYAIDLNPDAKSHLYPEVELFEQDCSQPWPLEPGSLQVVFTSNFFEHLPTKESLKNTLKQAHRCLVSGGRLVAMGPNIKYLPGEYWDFFDHHLPLTEKSLCEALETEGFRVEYVVPRFLPYTMVDARQYPLLFLKLYLRLPLAWRFKGRQFLVVAEKQ